MKEKTSFTRLVQLWGLLSLIGIGISIITIDIIGSYHDFNIHAERMRTDYIDGQKRIIRQEVHRVVEMINHDKLKSELMAKNNIKSRTYEACAVASNIHEQNRNSRSADQIREMILDALRPVRFENGKGYFFIAGMDGTGVLYPDNPDFEGSDLRDLKVHRSSYIVKNMIDIVRNRGEGFYKYHWIKSGVKDKYYRKISFLKYFEPYDWFIGTGLYMDDSEKQVKTDLLKRISRIKFGKEGYIFVNTLKGDVLVSNGRFYPGTKKLWEVFSDNPGKMKAIFKKEYDAALKPEGDYIYYNFIKLTDSQKLSPKASFIYGIPGWQWLVGAGVYLDDVENNITLMQEELTGQIRVKILSFLFISLGIIVIFLFFFNRLNRRLKNDIDLFISFFNRAALSDEPINRTLVHYDELDKMAENANRMLEDKIHARKELMKEREALRQSESKFRGLVESSSDWIWELDAKGVYTYSSPQIKAILGYTPDEINGRTPYDFIPPEESERVAAVFRDLAESSDPIDTLESVALHKDGRQVILETNGVPVFNISGEIIGYRGVARDITDRRKAEEELQKMQKLKSIGILAGGIAHDFNNILMGLYGNISLAKHALPEKHPALAPLKDAESSMDRATHLTSQFLTFARGGSPVREKIRLDMLAEEVIRFDLSGSSIKPVFSISDGLYLADVDKGQIQQVFSNLTINASQAMPDGGHLYITLENANIEDGDVPNLSQGKYIKISVQDEGKGIERKNMHKIFDPYFSTKDTGIGLGLTTVYSIINRHEGSITVDSLPGTGTTFTIYLPASDSLYTPEIAESAAENLSEKQSARILVMDDEEMIRSMLEQMLVRSGFSVETASDGSHAIEMYRNALDKGDPFDVVIMDLTIPGGIGGREAIRDILKIDPEARVIVSSGYTNDPVMSNYSDYGFHGIAVKPYTIDKLIEVLYRVMGK